MLREVHGPEQDMMISMMKGEVGEGVFKFKMENVNMGEGRLEALGERRATSSLAELIVAWSRGFLMRDINWEYMSLDCGLLKPFFD